MMKFVTRLRSFPSPSSLEKFFFFVRLTDCVCVFSRSISCLPILFVQHITLRTRYGREILSFCHFSFRKLGTIQFKYVCEKRRSWIRSEMRNAYVCFCTKRHVVSARLALVAGHETLSPLATWIVVQNWCRRRRRWPRRNNDNCLIALPVE